MQSLRLEGLRYSAGLSEPTRAQRRRRNCVNLSLATLRATLRNTLVLALGAWISMCCCDRRALTAAFLPSPIECCATNADAPADASDSCCESLPPCCAAKVKAKAGATTDAIDSCCASTDEKTDDTPRDSRDSHRCCGSCCVKWHVAPAQPDFTPDSIGAALIAALSVDATIVRDTAREAEHRSLELHRNDGEPPPRQRLVLTARFLI